MLVKGREIVTDRTRRAGMPLVKSASVEDVCSGDMEKVLHLERIAFEQSSAICLPKISHVEGDAVANAAKAEKVRTTFSVLFTCEALVVVLQLLQPCRRSVSWNESFSACSRYPMRRLPLRAFCSARSGFRRKVVSRTQSSAGNLQR